jgi:hypothetical protein
LSGLVTPNPAGNSGVFSSYRVAYRDDPAIGFRVVVVRAWARGEIEEPVMSASSGPKPYTRNHVWAIFDRYPAVARVMIVRGEYTGSIPFLLVTDGAGRVFDMAGKEVALNPIQEKSTK